MRGLRCTHCWAWWLGAVAAVLAWFGRIEWVGFDKGCHPTLSRRTKLAVEAVAGPRGVWLFTALGAAVGFVFSKHLADLVDLTPTEDPR